MPSPRDPALHRARIGRPSLTWLLPSRNEAGALTRRQQLPPETKTFIRFRLTTTESPPPPRPKAFLMTTFCCRCNKRLSFGNGAILTGGSLGTGWASQNPASMRMDDGDRFLIGSRRSGVRSASWGRGVTGRAGRSACWSAAGSRRFLRLRRLE